MRGLEHKNTHAYFESPLQKILKIVGFILLGLAAMAYKSLSDESGTGIFTVLIIAFLLMPLCLLILIFTNKKVPLLEINASGLTFRPSFRRQTITLKWDEIKQINQLKFTTKHNSDFLLIHVFNQDETISASDHKAVSYTHLTLPTKRIV